jgi:exosortase D (VPLPA-CTERM-specific)
MKFLDHIIKFLQNMSQARALYRPSSPVAALATWGTFWLIVMVAASLVFFREGIAELLAAWQLPEYSHGPLIPILSGLLFLRQLKTVPVRTGAVPDRWPGVVLMVLALVVALGGKLIQIGDIVTYAMIAWVGALLLISFGWRQGRQFWPPVLHLVYMLPLPGALYYGVSTFLQGISSELGVYFLQLLHVPVFLEGNIIDLGVYKLHVAEACSGLRYLFPILSFSYIFAVLYQGPTWHKAVLLISAAPITIVMNAVRIALAGLIVNRYGAGSVEGFSHFFEGWVIFVACIAILFALAWGMLFLRRDRVSLRDALDLNTDGLGTQAMRLRYLEPSRAFVGSTLVVVALTMTWQALPKRDVVAVNRDPFSLFPARIDTWQAGAQRALEPTVETVLAADDYYSASLTQTGLPAPVDLFIAWYADQNTGGVHSPEVCLPGGGWEIADLQQIAAPAAADAPFTLNRAIIQKGTSRMLVYYWFEQQGQRTASGLTAKMQLLLGKVANGRNDSAIVRLITWIDGADGMAAAAARLDDATLAVLSQLPRFIPDV